MKIKSLLAGLMMMALIPLNNAFAGTGTVTYLQFNSDTNSFLLIGLSDGTACNTFGDHGDMGAALASAKQLGTTVTLDCFFPAFRVIF